MPEAPGDLQALVSTCDGLILIAVRLAAGILVAVLTNANEMTTFLLKQT